MIISIIFIMVFIYFRNIGINMWGGKNPKCCPSRIKTLFTQNTRSVDLPLIQGFSV